MIRIRHAMESFAGEIGHVCLSAARFGVYIFFWVLRINCFRNMKVRNTIQYNAANIVGMNG